jgi:hypothetical protein
MQGGQKAVENKDYGQANKEKGFGKVRLPQLPTRV